MARFTDLPPEIRNAMYEDLFTVESKLQRRNQNELAMFTVSKQLHKESSSYFYQHNAIDIDVPWATTGTATILPPIANKYLRFLKRLAVHALAGQATLQRTQKAATAIGALSCIGANFDELNVLIKSPLSQILNSRVDDSTLDGAHPITMSIRKVLERNVAKTVRIHLHNTWFAPCIAQTLTADFGCRLEFYTNEVYTQDALLLERPLTGRYLSTHLIDLGLNRDNDMDMRRDENLASPMSTPSTLKSSLCSPFAELDTFSVSSFELGSDDCAKEDHHVSLANSTDRSEAPFFTEDDIEEWSAFTQEEQGSEEEDVFADLKDLDGDDEMEDVQQDELDAFMGNMEEVAHHVANDDDVTYMTNFAPDLLLSLHHLSHLV